MGKKIECKATLEKINTKGSKNYFYRLNLNNWDDHIENEFYLKTIWK